MSLSNSQSFGRPPGTASRLTTAMNRPVTRGASIPNQSIVINPAKADDRPMTRGGLGGLANASAAYNRTVQDKSFFLGVLRSKIGEINSEINRLNRTVTDISSDNSNYQAYGRKAEELSQQIEVAMSELLDYNTLIDRLNISSNEQDIKKDYLHLKAQNDSQTKGLDELFIEKGKREDMLRKLEKDIAEEKKRREKLLASLSGPIRTKYDKIKSESDRLQFGLDDAQNQIQRYKDRTETLKDQISGSTIKQEALMLLEQLHEAELKKMQLIDEAKSAMAPAEEREMLLKQVKENNQEIAVIEKQIHEIRENIDTIKRDLEDEADQGDGGMNGGDSSNNKLQGEDLKKYRELKKREAQMDDFLENFDENKRTEADQLNTTRRHIVSFLELISKGVGRTKKSLGESDDSKYANLTIADLQKVEKLETEVKLELDKLKERRRTMEEELTTYNDLDGLKKRSEARKQQLLVEKQNLSRYRENMKYEIDTLYAQVQAIDAQLNDNETHNQLCNLEKKLQIIEQNNFQLKEGISAVTAESDYEHLKVQVLQLVAEHNKWIQEQLAKPVSYE